MRAVFGRFLWAVVTALWPAVTAIRAEFHVHWLNWGLTWVLALAEAGCALMLRARARQRRRDWEAERQQAAEGRLCELEARVGAYGSALTAMAVHGRLDCPELEPGRPRLRSVPPLGKRA